MRRQFVAWTLTICALAWVVPAHAKSRPRPDTDQRIEAWFPVADGIEDAVEFWKNIYSRYHTKQVVLHDPVHMNAVYVALDLSHVFDEASSPAEAQKIAADAIEGERGRVARVLRGIAWRVENKNVRFAVLSAEERRFYDAFRGIEGGPDKFREAADRIRAQRGLRDEFLRGIWDSAPYMPYMEKSFRDRRIPVALTRLVFVESMFNIYARSHVGAAGPYQFMSYTGRDFMRIDPVVDERYDPIRASEGAARLLENNHRALGSWPLAITAYNHGVRGMKRAVEQVGTTDLGAIVHNYESRSFGFASRNFYAEFVAALWVYENRRALFKGHKEYLAARPPMIWDKVILPDYVKVETLTKYTSISADDLRRYNPAFTRYVYSGEKYVEKGYPIRLPRGKGQLFAKEYQRIPRMLRFKAQRRNEVHIVRRGENLSSIARRYGISIGTLMAWNHLHNRHRIYVGQRLRLIHKRKEPPVHASAKTPTVRVVDVVKLPGDEPRLHAEAVVEIPPQDALAAILSKELSETDPMAGEAFEDEDPTAAPPPAPSKPAPLADASEVEVELEVETRARDRNRVRGQSTGAIWCESHHALRPVPN